VKKQQFAHIYCHTNIHERTMVAEADGCKERTNDGGTSEPKWNVMCAAGKICNGFSDLVLLAYLKFETLKMWFGKVR
jgi:hypothetical protein